MWKRNKKGSMNLAAAVLVSIFSYGLAFGATISVDESTQYQTIDGFGAFGFRNVNWANPSEWWNDSFGDLIITDLGLTIHRNEYYPPGESHDTSFSEQAPYFQLLRDKAAQHGEPLKFIITYWTPPSWMKSNSAPAGGYLLPQYYDDFGDYTVDARDDFASIGVDVYAWSLQNEPLFAQSYNSCVYTGEQYRDMIKTAGPIIHSSYPNLKLFADEHMMFGIVTDWDWNNWSPINFCMNDSAANAQVGIWAMHGYSDGVNPDPASQADWVLARQRLQIDSTGRRFWMTETSGFTDTWTGGTGAFSLGTQIFSGLKYGHLSAWVWWQLGESGGGQYVLMNLDTPTKRYYVSKQFYRYIRPDAVMVDAGTDDSGVYAAAFTHSANNTLTIVLVNNSGGQRTMNLNLSGSIIPSQFTIYRTSSSENCVTVGTVSSTGQVTMPNSSITTLYGTATGPQPPGQASNPSPSNGATSVSVEADISWSAGSGADSHDVYFGQDSTPDSGEFQGNQSGTTFDLGTLSESTTYYWRIDEKNSYGTTTGNVWSFTTGTASGGPVGYTWCASEGQTVVFSETVDVAYGADGQFNYMYGVTGSITFDNATFGDPIPGVVKAGYYKVVGGGGNGTGLTGDYYDNMDFTGFALTRVDATVNFNWGSGSPDPAIGVDTFSVQWTGQVQPLYSENYTFYTNSDDGVRLWVNGQSLVNNWTDHGPTENSGQIALTAGTKYDIAMDFYENGGGAVAELRWSSPSQAKEVIPQTQLYEAQVSLPGQVGNPNPANGATSISTSANLSWSAGSGATSYNVYFGQDSTPDSGEFQGNQAGTTFDLGALANSTTYYWRIDSVNTAGTTTGNVWSFTTESIAAPGQASNPSPANSATGVSLTPTLSWTAGSGTTSHDVYFGSVTTPPFVQNQAGTTYAPGTLNAVTTYYWRINEVGPGGTTTGIVWSFVTAAPSTWSNQDIGSPSAAGSASESAGVWTIEGDGSDIWDTSDQFHYVYQSLGGDGEIEARVASLENTNSWAKAGVMIRESLTGGSTHAMMVVTPGNGTAFQRRTSTDGSSDHTAGSSVAAPYWVRLVRNGNTFTGYESSSGSSWNQVGSATVSMATDVYIGLAVTSHSGGVLCTAELDNVTVTGAGPQPPGQATNPSPANGATGVSTTTTLSWSAGTDATSHDVYFGTTSPGTFQGNQTETTYDPGTLAEVTTYYWRIDEKNAVGTTTGAVWSFTTVPPSEWISQDIGSPGVAGSASEVAGTWTIEGDGSDISGTSDSFHYVYQSVSGDAEIIARVVSFTNITADWAKAGVMFRETLAANSTYALNNYTTNVARSVNSWTILHRDTTGGSSTQTVWGTDQSPPYWMRLVRSGNSFSAYVSSNGSSWELIDTVTISMATDIYVGMAVTSHDSGSLSTGTFDNVQLIGG